MNNILKYLGVVVVILGAAVLAIYVCKPSNILLVVALVLEVLGLALHVVLNKMLK